MYERAPKIAIAETNANGRPKLWPLTNAPITVGMMMAARFEKKLNAPPVSPIRRFGASVETRDQLMDANPHPKNEKQRHAMT